VSHVAIVELCIDDLSDLKRACCELGLEFMEDKKTFKWYGKVIGNYKQSNSVCINGIWSKNRDTKDYGRCEHAIGIKGSDVSYELGVVKSSDGIGYKLVYDNWRGGKGLEDVIGINAIKLSREYSAQRVTSVAQRNGYRIVSREIDNSGNIRVRCSR